MTAESTDAGLLALEEAALRRRESDARREREAEEAEAAADAAERERVLAAVRRDHPYLDGHLDPAGFHFGSSGEADEADDVYRARREEAYLKTALLGHEPVRLVYRLGAGGWAQGEAGDAGECYGVEADWAVDLGREDGVRATDWLYFRDLGDALLAARESYEDRCRKTQEAVRRRQEQQDSARRLAAAPPMTVAERLVYALRDFVIEKAGEVDAAGGVDVPEF